jgi:hypothetical protein
MIPLLVPILSHMNRVHTTPAYFSKIHFNSSVSYKSRSSLWSHSFTSLTKTLYAVYFAPVCATCHTPRLHLYILFGKEYLFGPNILLSALITIGLTLCSSISVRDQVSHSHISARARVARTILARDVKLYYLDQRSAEL